MKKGQRLRDLVAERIRTGEWHYNTWYPPCRLPEPGVTPIDKPRRVFDPLDFISPPKPEPPPPPKCNPHAEDVISALINLGAKKAAARQAVAGLAHNSDWDFDKMFLAAMDKLK